MKYIQSAHNETLKHLGRLLHSAAARRRCAQAVLEGAHLLEAYLQAGGRPQQVFIPQHKLESAETQKLAEQVGETHCTLLAGAAAEKTSRLDTGAELLTLITLPAEPALPHTGDCVVLERVQDPGNAGTILRSAAACGIRSAVFGADCVDAWSPKVLRAGMGAHFSLDISVQADLAVWRAGFNGTVLATALGGNNRNLYELDLRPPAAWLFGNEGSGISDAMQQAADATVRIPMPGRTESLNVAMAATVCLFEQLRQRMAG